MTGGARRRLLTLAAAGALAGAGVLAAVAGAGALTATAGAATHEGSWSRAGDLTVERFAHTATLLGDGRVLAVGGDSPGTDTVAGPHASVEVYDPAARRWQVTFPLHDERRRHTASLLDDGRVLVAGGQGCPSTLPSGETCQVALASVELFDPDGGEWVLTGPLAQGRVGHSATVLGDGRVLVAGGVGADGAPLASAEVYDPAAGTWQAVGALGSARSAHTATVLDDGRVLVTGGRGADGAPLASTEVYDPTAGAWQAAAPMASPRAEHTAVALHGPDCAGAGAPSHCGQVLAVGGTATTAAPRAETYDPDADAWVACAASAGAPDCPAQRRSAHTATVLGDGTVLLVGGVDQAADDPAGFTAPQRTAERYDPATATWWTAAAPESAWREHTATVLADGTVLAAGTRDGCCRGRAEVYSPVTVPAPVVAAVTPTGGPVAGGTAVTITGEHLGEAVAVHFGDAPATVVDVAGGQVSATAPAHPAGTVAVTVTTPGGRSAASDDATFTFAADDGAWQPTGQMTAPRREPGMVVLDGPGCGGAGAPDYCGQVLIVSGDEGRTTELYDPASGTFSSCGAAQASPTCPGPLPAPVAGAHMTVPPRVFQGYTTSLDGPACRGSAPPAYCGRVLVAAPDGDPNYSETYAALYDPATGRWRSCAAGAAGPDCPAGALPDRVAGTALLDGPECHRAGAPAHCGQVLAGGWAVGDNVSGPSWRYEPATGQWTPAPALTEGRYGYTMTLLDDPACAGEDPPAACGSVLVAGGWDLAGGGSDRPAATAEVYDPAAGVWRTTATPRQPGRIPESGGFTPSASATALADGRVLLAGGFTLSMGGCEVSISDQVEAFDPAAEAWAAMATLPEPRRHHADAALGDGRVLLIGGEVLTPAGRCARSASVAVMDPAAGAFGAWTYTDSMAEPRSHLSAIALPEGPTAVCGPRCGGVLAVGGRTTGGDTLATAEVYVPADLGPIDPDPTDPDPTDPDPTDPDPTDPDLTDPAPTDPGVDVCPPAAVPPAAFTDRDAIPTAHRPNVDCAAWQEIVAGFADGTYGPTLQVRRDQMASFITRTLAAAGVDLPAPTGERFTDVAPGSPHDQAIHRLAAAGIVLGGPGGLPGDAYGPGLRVRRDQMASFLLRAAAFATGADLASATQAFDDVPPGNAHFANVNGAAQAGLAAGFGDGTYRPGADVRRDQMATFVIRLLQGLADGSLAGS